MQSSQTYRGELCPHSFGHRLCLQGLFDTNEIWDVVALKQCRKVPIIKFKESSLFLIFVSDQTSFLNVPAAVDFSPCINVAQVVYLLPLFVFPAGQSWGPWLVGSRRFSPSKRTPRRQQRRRKVRALTRRPQRRPRWSTPALSAG